MESHPLINQPWSSSVRKKRIATLGSRQELQNLSQQSKRLMRNKLLDDALTTTSLTFVVALCRQWQHTGNVKRNEECLWAKRHQDFTPNVRYGCHDYRRRRPDRWRDGRVITRSSTQDKPLSPRLLFMITTPWLSWKSSFHHQQKNLVRLLTH